jgi:ACR3 family arsenite transporter
MSTFERFLSLWVALCIVAGIALGHVAPHVFASIADAEVANVNLPIAALTWLMIIPMLLKIDFGALSQVREHWRGVGVTLFINWAVKPFSMALLGTIFVAHLFAPLLSAAQIPSYIAGLILLAAAPCTAMVFVWSNLCEGEPHYTLSQVALNDVITVFLFAPLVGLLLGVASITVPWDTLLLSVMLYIVVPVIIAQVWRHFLLTAGEGALQRTLRRLQPLSLIALLATLVLLFGFQVSISWRSRWSSRCWRCRSSFRSISMPGLLTGSAAVSASPGVSPRPLRSSAPAISSNSRSPPRSACSV